MDDRFSRRSVLGSIAVGGLASLAGCSLDNPDVAGGHLFVENTLPNEYLTHLVVTEGRNREGSAVVEGWFRVPGNFGIQFANVIEPGQAYTVAVRIRDASPSDRVVVTIPACEGGDAGRDVSVRLREDGTGIIPWGCDGEYTRLELEYARAERFAVEGPTETAADGE